MPCNHDSRLSETSGQASTPNRWHSDDGHHGHALLQSAEAFSNATSNSRGRPGTPANGAHHRLPNDGSHLWGSGATAPTTTGPGSSNTSGDVLGLYATAARTLVLG